MNTFPLLFQEKGVRGMRPDHGFSSYQQLLISPVYIGFIITTLSSLPSHFLRLNLFYQVSDKGLLERCGTGKGYLIEIPPIQSDLRVCASGEPKSEQNGLVHGCSVSR
jgi:hypothetical protein